MLSGDIESNPGPGDVNETSVRQTRSHSELKNESHGKVRSIEERKTRKGTRSVHFEVNVFFYI